MGRRLPASIWVPSRLPEVSQAKYFYAAALVCTHGELPQIGHRTLGSKLACSPQTGFPDFCFTSRPPIGQYLGATSANSSSDDVDALLKLPAFLPDWTGGHNRKICSSK